MTGMNRETGRALDGWAHVEQSVAVILSTQIGERSMRRWFGFVGLRLLGETGTRANILRFFTAVTIAIDLWEPRFAVKRIETLTLTRDGKAGFRIVGEYRPRGHLGDPTPEGTRRIFLGPSGALSGS